MTELSRWEVSGAERPLPAATSAASPVIVRRRITIGINRDTVRTSDAAGSRPVHRLV